MNKSVKLVLVTSTILTSMAWAAVDQNAKAIVIADRQPALTTIAPVIAPVQSTALNLQVSTEKASYAVNEAIRFNVVTNKDAYLYLLNELPDQTTLLLPNNKDKENFVRANTVSTFPRTYSNTVEFYSDAVGIEKILVIASEKPLDLHRILTQQKGVYQVGQTESLINNLQQKAIRIVDRDTGTTVQGNNPAIVSTRLSIPVGNPTMPVMTIVPTPTPNVVPVEVSTIGTSVAQLATNPQGVRTFIAADQSTYRTNQVINVSYGASDEGYVTLAQVYQNGSVQILNRQRADRKFMQEKVVANQNTKALVAWVSAIPQNEGSVTTQSQIPQGAAMINILVMP